MRELLVEIVALGCMRKGTFDKDIDRRALSDGIALVVQEVEEICNPLFRHTTVRLRGVVEMIMFPEMF